MAQKQIWKQQKTPRNLGEEWCVEVMNTCIIQAESGNGADLIRELFANSQISKILVSD